MTARTLPQPAIRFKLGPEREAAEPPERRGLTRDGVRLLVAGADVVAHRRFRDLPAHLSPGDLLVVNTSGTVPAALEGRRGDGRATVVHVSTELPDGTWVIELRRPDRTGPQLDGAAGERVEVRGRLRLRLVAPYPDPTATASRLWRAVPDNPVALLDYLARHGRPIRYAHPGGRFRLDEHQTVYADRPGSAEMASAGRPFTAEGLVRLMARGITVAPIVLHAGVSSQEAGEPPLPERFEVPADTARLVNSARCAGRRVVAVGTTVVRSLETAADADGFVEAAAGWTDLVLGPDRPARVVTGLITGLHAPEASHLLLLEAVAGPELVTRAYRAALGRDYLWHEFGDSTLFLPTRCPG
ncbi:S-adenosylmethionine:tRNA ribosyltransferase-isomerase [Sporichthya sp.]|uniref:S-adenosylmethionine:tRNA ribosyltransferase-isomerase n=1 Tax=Sporichthya sp. TaxID=65475 RepID=UPI0017ED1DA0|nr:S-adenosylmethionine:tRNA ribosyltransferase-isomerase [Sporichthya sp.]MBA3743917.1 S-adenosylmethionine:tRNA ribosyltransferase-isomerase [Sporichthya sp.]